MKHKSLLMLVAISVLSLAACSSGRVGFFGGQETATPASTPTPLPTPIQEFQTTISADGEVILPVPPQTFSFQTSGLSATIEEVYVTAGQAVTKGDLLARVDPGDLQSALDKAEASLALLEAQIANEQAAPLPGDITEAAANLTAAQEELAHLNSLPSEEAITQAAADLRLREVELRQAQEAYDVVAYAEGIGMSPQAAELQRATLNYERAQAIYDEATQPATKAQLAQARLAVVQARNRLDKLLAKQRPEARAVDEARLQQARLEVEEARANLVKATLVAPWNGVVMEVNAAPGVSSSNASVTIAQVEPLRFATSNFSERNLGDIEVGDEATLYLKAYPSVPMPAVVYRVELESGQKDGDTALFTVYLDFNSGEFQVQPGMTGRVEIAIDRAS